jgi:hypothetical protein
MKCLTCDRTLSAGGSSHPMSVDGIEMMFAELLGWTERPEGWTCAQCDSGRLPEGQDAEERRSKPERPPKRGIAPPLPPQPGDPNAKG